MLHLRIVGSVEVLHDIAYETYFPENTVASVVEIFFNQVELL